MTQPGSIPGRAVCTVKSDLDNGRPPAQAITPQSGQIQNDILYNALCVYAGNEVRVQIGETKATFRARGGNVPFGRVDNLADGIKGENNMSIGMNHVGNIPLLGIVDEVLFYNRPILENEGDQLFCLLDHGEGPTCPQ